MTHNESNFLIDYSQFLDETGNHLNYSALSTYRNFADGLSKKEKIFFDTHLDTCPACIVRMREVEEIEFKETKRQTANILLFSPMIFRYAAAAVLIIAVSIAVVYKTQRYQKQQLALQEVHTEEQIAAITPDPEKFIPNQVLENFIERSVRSSQNVILVAPAAGETLSTPYAIKWQGPNERYTVVIVNNHNLAEWEQSVSSATEIELGFKLEPGLHYLKLEMNEDLVLVRKFLILH